MTNIMVLIVVFGLLSGASGNDGLERTAGGKVRPSIPKLFLTEAGRVPVAEVKLDSFKPVTICPRRDYPNGFSFRCETTTGPDFGTVVFRVSGAVFHKEYSAPYYISENTREGLVRPFPYDNFSVDDKINRTRLRIACRVRTRRPVWIDLITQC